MAAAASPLSRALLWLPRFLLGNLGGFYYAVLPMFIYLKNVYCGGCTAYAWLATILGAGVPLLFWTVMPWSWLPYGDEKRLYEGISDFYNKSSGIWIQVWGEHMHSGHYGADGQDVDKDPQQAQVCCSLTCSITMSCFVYTCRRLIDLSLVAGRHDGGAAVILRRQEGQAQEHH